MSELSELQAELDKALAGITTVQQYLFVASQNAQNTLTGGQAGAFFGQLAAVASNTKALTTRIYNDGLSAIENLRATAVGIQATLANDLSQSFRSELAAFRAYLSSLSEESTDAIILNLNRAEETQRTLSTTVGLAMSQAAEEVADTATTLTAHGIERLLSVNNAALNTIDRLGTTILTELQAILNDNAGATELTNTVALDALDAIVSQNKALSDDLFLLAQNFLSAQAEQLRTFVGNRSGDVNVLQSSILGIAPGILQALQFLLPSLLAGGTVLLTEWLTSTRDSEGTAGAATVNQAFSGLSAMASQPELTLGQAVEAVRSLAPSSPLARLFAGVITWVNTTVRTLNGVSDALGQRILQEYSVGNPWALPHTVELVEGYVRGEITLEEYRTGLARHGLSLAHADLLYQNRLQVQDETRLREWLHRGEITQEDYERELSRAGWHASDIASATRTVDVVPPIADLIHMAVREAFSPDVAQRFGAFEDFPPEFAAEAKKHGLTEEWAQRYWAAHWGLPSLTMGFEMLHRGIIGVADLELLMRAQDVQPFWREKLMQLSFKPLTRIDVQRMHKLGVLSLVEVENAYLDLGYDRENAARMARFVEQLNSPKEKITKEKLKDLSQTSVLDAYSIGLLNSGQAIERLLTLGYDGEEADLLISIRSEQDAHKARLDYERMLIEQVKAEIISPGQAEDLLNAAGVTPTRLEQFRANMIQAQLKRRMKASRADLDKFYKKGLIEKADYVGGLLDLGYDDTTAQLFLATIDVPTQGQA